MMRHLVEVMLVLEGKQPWARSLRDRRKEQGLPLPLPSMISDDDDDDDDDDDHHHHHGGVLCGLLRVRWGGIWIRS